MRDDLRAGITVKLFTDRKCFGPGVAELLEHVEELHSLRAAAQAMAMAYSKAWSIVKNAEAGLSVKLLHSTTGGRNGGGATLTPEGERILRAYRAYCASLERYGAALFDETFAFLHEEENA